MSLNKLLLVFSLVAISLSDKIPVKYVKKYADIPKSDPELVTWRKNFASWDSKGLVKDTYGCDLDFNNGYTFLNKTKPKKGIKDSDPKFFAIEANKVSSLKASRKNTDAINDAEDKCKEFEFPYDEFEHISYAAYFLDDDNDFYPSFRYTLYKGPRQQYITYDDGSSTRNEDDEAYGFVNGAVYKYISDIGINCHRGGLDYFVLDSLYRYGVVSEGCIPNEFKDLPGYDKVPTGGSDKYTRDSYPKIVDQCDFGSFKAYFKGYSFGELSGTGLELLKKALIRFGPVKAYTSYYIQGSSSKEQQYLFDRYEESTGLYRYYQVSGESRLIIGWDGDKIYEIVGDKEQVKKVEEVPLKRNGYIRTRDGSGREIYTEATVDIKYGTLSFFGNGVSVVRAALSVIAAAVVIPALALFF